MSIAQFIAGYGAEVVQRTLQHLSMVAVSLGLAITIAVPLGVAITGHERVARWVIEAASILFTVPSLALFALLVVALAPIHQGTGNVPAIIALTLYSVLPIVRNTYIALRQVDPSTVEAALGMGMTPSQTMVHVKLPLALPLIMAGIRNSGVMAVGVATIATLIGGGGLGHFIFEGIARTNRPMVIVGTVAITVLGLAVNEGLLLLEEALTPGRPRRRKQNHD
ncbi:MAG: ABC transporter permease [Candidatus Cryosericum sp.]